MEKHSCRICNKCFPTGRSLGGHMRSHVISYTSELPRKKKKEEEEEKINGKVKKLLRVSDLGDDGDDPTSSSSTSLKLKQCKECCKVFPSPKALFGHMRCHSTKICRRTQVKIDQEEEHEGYEEESISDNNNNGVYEEEQEEVAISLMMLSRDLTGCWPSDSSDNHSMVFEDNKSLVETDYNSGDELKRKRSLMNIETEFEKKLTTPDTGVESKWGKSIGYQCISCNKSFHSYQALGGHRASHKKIKPCSSFEGTAHEHSSSFEVSHSCQQNKTRVHKCSVCDKTFSSGQALGGHKRSHVAANTAAAVVNVPELLDLNFPAPIDELQQQQFSNVKPWMSCDNIDHHKHQHLVDFISN